MDLFELNVDEDAGLARITDPAGFTLKKRIVYSESQVNKAIFRSGLGEEEDQEDILQSEREDMSSLVYGGAGTGWYLCV